MKKITFVLLIAIIAIGISSCKKDDKKSNSDIADKYVGNWIGSDTETCCGYMITARAASFKKVNSTEVLILGFPSVGDTLKANVGNTSIVVTYSSDDSYGDPIDAHFNYISEGKI